MIPLNSKEKEGMVPGRSSCRNPLTFFEVQHFFQQNTAAAIARATPPSTKMNSKAVKAIIQSQWRQLAAVAEGGGIMAQRGPKPPLPLTAPTQAAKEGREAVEVKGFGGIQGSRRVVVLLQGA